MDMPKGIVFMFIFLISCTSNMDNFYRTSHTEDIDVLPLIKPYRLWTPIPGESVWHLNFRGKVKDKYGFTSHTNVCEINIVNKVIYGHCLSASYGPNFYFVIVPSENIEKAFDSKEEWDDYLKSKHVNSEVLFDVLTVYNSFKENPESLPWYKEIKYR